MTKQCELSVRYDLVAHEDREIVLLSALKVSYADAADRA